MRENKNTLKSEYTIAEDAADRISNALGVLENDAVLDAEVNKELFAETHGQEYLHSYLNPDHAVYAENNSSGAASALIYLFQSAIEDAFRGDAKSVYAKQALLKNIADELTGSQNENKLVEACRLFMLENMSHRIDNEIKDLTAAGEENFYENILNKSNAHDLSWIYEYGVYIDPLEIEMAEFYFKLPDEKLQTMAERIVNAFLHGFISQSRDRRGRQRVRFFYQIGQEALAKQVLAALDKHGLKAVLTKPQSINQNDRYAVDHEFDECLAVDEDYVNKAETLYKAAYEKYRKPLMDTCGMIGIGQFGASPSAIKKAVNAVNPDADTLGRYSSILAAKRDVESEYLKPSELSFCKVTFPNLLVGDEFESVFDEVFDFNMAESEPFELLQQKLIDALDKCVCVRVVGRYDNKTDITVQFAELTEPEKQTNFLNCGGDLNIPHGEVFTTPKLSGSTGLYHVPHIYLQGKVYKDLTLGFVDGMITSYSCNNFDDEAKNREYIEKNLLFPHKTMTMGEWAIGTNTAAHRVFSKYKLFDKLPILLAEKVGPHLAIGDPCFARGEDAPVYNLYDKKEMTARENERTKKRREQNVYYNKHIDITISYHEIGKLSGYTAGGSEIKIMEDGKFVLEGTEALNEALSD